MAKLRIQAPDGKTLVIDAGDDPAQYDAIVDDVMKDYAGQAQQEQPKPGVMDRIKNEFKDPMAYIPGARMAQLGSKLLDKSNEGWQMIGEGVTEGATRLGAPPVVAAAAGLPVTMANDLAGAASVLQGPVSGLSREIAKGGLKAPLSSMGAELSQMGKSLKTLPGKALNRITRGPATEEISEIRKQQRLLTGKQEAAEDFTKSRISDTGRDLEAARERIGAPQNLKPRQLLGKDPRTAAMNADDVVRIPLKKLAQMDAKELLEIRDASAAMIDATTDIKAIAKLSRMNKHIDNALITQGGDAAEVGARYKQYGVLSKKADDVPSKFKKDKADMGNRIEDLKDKSAREKHMRKLIPSLVGLGGLGKFLIP